MSWMTSSASGYHSRLRPSVSRQPLFLLWRRLRQTA